MNEITENWYNQILLLSEAYPLSQAKYYSSLEKKVNEELVQPIWDRIVQLGDFTSKRKERVYFKHTTTSGNIPDAHLVHNARRVYGQLLIELVTLLDLGLLIKDTAPSNISEEERLKLIIDITEEKYIYNYNGNETVLELEVEERYEEGDTEIFLYDSRASLDLVDNMIKESTGRKTKVGKVVELLAKKYLLPSYAASLKRAYKHYNDTRVSIAGPKISQQDYIVISRHPYDVAGMSTGRGWKSCMRLPDLNDPSDSGGSNVGYVKCDVKQGSFIAYLIKPDDFNIQNPVGRVLVKPYYNSFNNTLVYRPEHKVYGTTPGAFLQKVRDIFEEVSPRKSLPLGTYELMPGLYADTPQSAQFLVKADYMTLSYENKKDYIDYNVRTGHKLTDEEFKATPEDLQDYYIESGVSLTDGQFNLIKSNSKLVERYEEITIKRYKELLKNRHDVRELTAKEQEIVLNYFKTLSHKELKDELSFYINTGRVLLNGHFQMLPDDLKIYYIDSRVYGSYGIRLSPNELDSIMSNKRVLRRYVESMINGYKKHLKMSLTSSMSFIQQYTSLEEELIVEYLKTAPSKTIRELLYFQISANVDLFNGQFEVLPDDLVEYYIGSGGVLNSDEFDLIRSDRQLVQKYRRSTFKKYKELLEQEKPLTLSAEQWDLIAEHFKTLSQKEAEEILDLHISTGKGIREEQYRILSDDLQRYYKFHNYVNKLQTDKYFHYDPRSHETYIQIAEYLKTLPDSTAKNFLDLHLHRRINLDPDLFKVLPEKLQKYYVFTEYKQGLERRGGNIWRYGEYYLYPYEKELIVEYFESLTHQEMKNILKLHLHVNQPLLPGQYQILPVDLQLYFTQQGGNKGKVYY